MLTPWQSYPDSLYSGEGGGGLKTSGVGVVDVHLHKNEAGPLPHTVHNNYLKMA